LKWEKDIMEKESSENHQGCKKSKNPVNTPLFNFDMPGIIGNMKQSPHGKMVN
jgi:hypothetical protein